MPFRSRTDPRTGRALLFLASALPVGTVALTLLVTGWALAVSLSITPLVVPILIGFGWSVRLLGRAEGRLARELLGARTAPTPAVRRRRGFWSSGFAVLSDRGFWREQAYLSFRVVAGWPLAILELSVLSAALGLIGAPLYYRWLPQDTGPNGLDFAVWSADTLPKALLLVPIGAVLLVAALSIVRPLAALWGRLAESLLASGGTVRPVTPAGRRRALGRHAAFSLGVNALLVLIWALTGRGYFWPEWTMLSLGLVLAVHAWVVFVLHDPGFARGRRMTPVLAIHLGLTACLFLFLAGTWAVTTRGYFWPVWALNGLATALVIHWVAVLRRRADRLETTRAGAVDVQETDLRRIERDLHDGAQARLVALGMSLGLAEQKLDGDPEAARALVSEARLGVGEALRELRDLARGIRPPVLTDRGLEAAIAALADRSPLPVGVTADIERRPPDAVETAAYFVVAETLTNAAKHAHATRVDVRLSRLGDTLAIAVSDDGEGGADPEGSGLVGLRRRVEALDGRLRVTSPAGGPTVVHAELPCGS